MSDQLTHKEDVIQKLIISGAHLGGKCLTKQMTKYVWKKKQSGVYMFDVQKQYEKIHAAARIIAAVPDSSAIISVSGRSYGQRAVYKFGKFTKSISIGGRWTPGMLTNQNTDKYVEPRLLVLTDPRIDINALKESTYMNIPIIALCNTDNNLEFVDCAIPCNNRSKRSLAMVYWLLTREVLNLKGELDENNQFTELPDLFMYRNIEKEEKERKEQSEEKVDEEQNQEEDQEEHEDQFVDDN
jgi:small subunit ribosomal protein SAe